MDAIQAVRELGKAIQEDERYIEYAKAKKANDEDTELQNLIGEFNLKRIAINNENTKEEKDGEKLKRLDAELREVYARIMQNEHMAAYNEAKTELDKQVHAVGAIVTMSAQGQDPDEVQTGGCGGDCAGCAGCH